MDFSTFYDKWSRSGAAESSNAQSFTNDLCVLIGVAKPDPTHPDESHNRYVFEKSVPSPRGVKKIDCYKRGHFILENKQGASEQTGGAALSKKREDAQKARKTGHGKRGSKAWDTAMERARKQAENYARLLSGDEISGGRPPFILVADVGHSIACYADWSRAGGHYQPFPDANSYRIQLADLADAAIRERLHAIWTDPLSLDPARRSARVTKEIADRLARLAKSLDNQRAATQETHQVSSGEARANGNGGSQIVNRNSEIVNRQSAFLMRCLFTMFAEDVGLLEDRAFTELLEACRQKPVSFVPKITELWEKMNAGGYSVVLDTKVRRFNGGLFSDTSAVALSEDQIQLLLEAARADWREVEPAIFGTLLERALDPRERHKLGAHYTPRAYVERLVQPTILEPLRREWDGVQAAALRLANDGEDAKAIAEVERYLQRLADVRVLDPACGSANFLYVTLELLKRLEGEVRNVLRELGQGQISIDITGATITPENMLGIELNPRAARIAELVLWIGYLQWHLRSTGGLSDIGDPVLRDYHNIENRDAVLEWDRIEPVLDEAGEPVTRWDGVTYKTHPVTGEQVPDDRARTQVQRIIGGRATSWPEADFIVGNPPFIGEKKMKEALGIYYTEAVRSLYSSLPACDFVMYWWQKSAAALSKDLSSFGFITTNSITQTQNRKVLTPHLDKNSIIYAVPDHPWVDSSDGADVRIAMTVVQNEENLEGILDTVIRESSEDIGFKRQVGIIHSNLSVGVNILNALSLDANKSMIFQGVKLVGAPFKIEEEVRGKWLRIDKSYIKFLPELVRGSHLTKRIPKEWTLDLYGLKYEDDVKAVFPEGYQYLYDTVREKRLKNSVKFRREYWWIHGAPASGMRDALLNLDRYIGTSEVAKHRTFSFLSKEGTIADGSLAVIASSDAFVLAVLSSRIHTTWAWWQGGRMGIGNDLRYQNGPCFQNFPFPTPTEPQKIHIRALAERLDAHRKRQQSLHPKLTMTGMYNVLERLRAEEPLSDKERKIHEQGLVGILREIHDELDEAVALAYGWPADLGEQDILQRLVDLNAERAAEEARGLVRWLRPDYQAPEEARGVQSELDMEDAAPVAVVAQTRKWPKSLPEQATALRELLASVEEDLPLAGVATAFKPKLSKRKLADAEKLLDTLVALGQAELGEGGYHAV